ncbi:16592_t:CDS:2, partial [Acaulospora colombiana]
EGGVKYLKVKLSDKHNHMMLCDIEDYKLVISHRWYAKNKVKSKDRCYHCMDGDSVAFHHLLFPQWAVISHINKNQLDNRQFNLYNGRIQAKTYSNNKSSYNGVYFDRSKQRWIVIWYNNCKSKVRYFPDTEKEDEIYDSNEDADKDFNDHDYIKEDDMELEKGDVNIGHEDYIDPKEGLNIELVSMNTSERVNNQEYDMEEVFDFEKFNDNQFNEQSWIDQFLDM